jgi:hypothetical protein
MSSEFDGLSLDDDPASYAPFASQEEYDLADAQGRLGVPETDGDVEAPAAEPEEEYVQTVDAPLFGGFQSGDPA